MGLSGGSQSSTQNTSPWEGQQPYLRDLFSESQRLYRGSGPEYFDGNTVAPFSDLTQFGLGAQAQRGASGSPTEAALNQYIQGTLGTPGVDPTAIMAAGGAQTGIGMGGADILFNAADPNNYFNSGSAAALDPSRFTGFRDTVGNGPGVAQGGINRAITMNPFQVQSYGGGGGTGPDFANSTVQSVAEGSGITDIPRGTLESTAQGNFLEANPYLESQYEAATSRVKEDFSDVVTPAINAAFSKAGRSGSALQAQAIGDAADDLTTNLSQAYASIFGDNYQQERGRQVDAAGQLGNFDLAGGGLSLDAARLGLTDDLARRGLNTDLFTSDADRSLAASSTALSDDLARSGLSFDSMFDQQSNELDFFSDAAGRSLAAGSDLFGGLNSGVGNLISLYGTDTAARQGAAGLTEMASGLDYQNIEAMLASGQITDEQAQRMIDAEVDRFNYYQNLPEMRLLQYANIVNQNPFSQSTGRSSGFNLGAEF